MPAQPEAELIRLDPTDPTDRRRVSGGTEGSGPTGGDPFGDGRAVGNIGGDGGLILGSGTAGIWLVGGLQASMIGAMKSMGVIGGDHGKLAHTGAAVGLVLPLAAALMALLGSTLLLRRRRS